MTKLPVCKNPYQQYADTHIEITNIGHEKVPVMSYSILQLGVQAALVNQVLHHS